MPAMMAMTEKAIQISVQTYKKGNANSAMPAALFAYVCRNGSLRYFKMPMQSVASLSSRIEQSAAYAAAVSGKYGEKRRITVKKKTKSATLSSAEPRRVCACSLRARKPSAASVMPPIRYRTKNGAENGLNAKSKNEIPMRSMLKMFGICPMTNTSIHE